MRSCLKRILFVALLMTFQGCASSAKVTIGSETSTSSVSIEPVSKNVTGEPELFFCADCTQQTLNYFRRHAPFAHLSFYAPNAPCDVRLKILWDRMGTGTVTAESAETGAVLLTAEAEGEFGPVYGVERLGPIVYNAFAPGSPLYRQIAGAKKAEEAAFQEIAARYRSMPVKPNLPEEARKYRVQAEAALKDHRFSEAADRYQYALALAPWWPEGHFNRALILGEEGRYDRAVREMKKYLALVPGAADARAAQDKIYEWEGLAKSGQGRSAASADPSIRGQGDVRSMKEPPGQRR